MTGGAVSPNMWQPTARLRSAGGCRLVSLTRLWDNAIVAGNVTVSFKESGAKWYILGRG